MLNCGFLDFEYRGASSEIGESTGDSTSHKNGYCIDFGYLRKDKETGKTHLWPNDKDGGTSWKDLEVDRQNKFHTALGKFGWKSLLSWRYWDKAYAGNKEKKLDTQQTSEEWEKINNEQKKTSNKDLKTLINITHYKNHHHHLHVQGWAPSVEKMDGTGQTKKDEQPKQEARSKHENQSNPGNQTPPSGVPPIITTPRVGCTTYLLLPALLILLLCIFAGCASAHERSLSLPFSSDHLTEYYTEADNHFDLTLLPEYKNPSRTFTQQESAIEIQGWNICGKKIDTNMEYAEIGQFYLGDFLYKLISYEVECDSSFPALNIQLNSYINGNLIDALLLENRLEYEDVQHFTQFKIDKKLIYIYYYVTYTEKTDEEGNLIGSIENPIQKLSKQAKYQIKNGYFRLISKKESKK